ncbi:sensor histidine kinase [Sinomonas sp. P10A9]|uniref:histidine kinase n=1 Tax=Sinomonas puerhi TaxID=3238584 RepID=A0AB39L7H9_9MICC
MLARWKSASLRTQLVAIMMVLLTGAIFLTAAATVTQLRTYLVGQLDLRLTNASDYAKKNQDIDLLTTANPLVPQDYVLVIYPEGGQSSVYYEQDTSQGRPDIPAISADEARTMQQQDEVRQVRGTVSSIDWRYTAIPVRIVASNTPAAIVIALPLTDVEDAIQHTLTLTAGVGIVMLASVFLIATWTVTRAFRPLRRVEKTAAAIAAGDLSQRVDAEAPGTELGRLSSSLNAMLAHIEVAFQARMASESRMRRFISDASHELRTPLVTIRGFSELYRHGALATDDDVSTAMGRIESEAKRMGTMVEDLLTLARLDEQRPLTLKPIDLLPVGHDAVVDVRATAPDRTVRLLGLGGGSPAPAPTLGDEARIRQVVGNLVGNALQYTPKGSPLEVAVGTRSTDGRSVAVLELRDHGPGIDEKDAAKIFERFYRADTSRNRETGGTGLGLAIVAAIIGSHHGTVRYQQTDGGGSTFVIEMPYAAVPERPSESPAGMDRDSGSEPSDGSADGGSEPTTARGGSGSLPA